MIKKIILSISLLFSLMSVAQEGTSSPYSFYGIGDVRFKGTVENRAMGGLSVFPDSIHLNLQNPAHLASLKLTSFAVGGTYSNTTLKTVNDESKTKRTTFDYLAVGLPLGKAGVSFGIMPYSSVGYKIQSVTQGDNPDTKRFNGIGGINKAFVGVGFNLNKNFSLGADVQYNFGTIETTSITFKTEVQNGSRERNTSDVTGVTFNTGLAYNGKVNKKLRFYSAVTYAPESNLKLSNQRNIAVVQLQLNGGFAVLEDQDIDVENTTVKIPSRLAFSAAIGEAKKWSVGSEITFQGTSSLGNRFNDIDNVRYENTRRYVIGGFYIPKYASFNNYFNKVTYRAGLRYEKTGLVINSQSIEDQAITLGLGLPLGGTFSNINLGFELGKRGKTSYGLVQENFLNFSVGLTFNDQWFRRRKID